MLHQNVYCFNIFSTLELNSVCSTQVLKGLKIMCGKCIKSIYILMKHTKNLTWKHILENVQLDETHCDLLTPFSRWRWFHREKLPKRRQPCVASHAYRGSCECCSSRLYSQMSNFHSALGTSHPRATLLQPHHPKKVCAKESHQSSSYVWFSAWATFGPVWRGQFHSSACNMLENMKKQSWEKANNCNYCDFASSCSDVLKRHMKIHSGER